MPRLIDDLRAPGARLQMPVMIAEEHDAAWAGYAQHATTVLRDPDLTVMLIDNVAEYFYSGSDQEYWDLRQHFPNLAPPYKRWWSEHKMPRLIHSKEKGDTRIGDLLPHGRVGCLFTAVESGEYKGVDVPENVRWIIWADIFIDYNDHTVTAQGPHGATFFAIDHDGALVDVPWMQTYVKRGLEQYAKSLLTWYNPSLLAVSFLHCKNVAVEDNHTPKPLAKKYRAKHGADPVVYKTLVIEPLKQVLRSQGRSHEVGLPKALHICRGHFADYREGRGLFGKYHGRYWIPQTVRGSRGEKAPPREIEVKV